MLHPSIVVLLWSGLLAATQGAHGRGALVSAVLILSLAAWRARERLVLLLRRTRYLMLAIVLVFAWGTPGHLMWPQLDWASPTSEGLTLALTHANRLLCVLGLVALLLALMPLPKLVEALHGITWPLGWAGLDRTRAALRLTLVLDYTAAARHDQNWRSWLEDDAPVGDSPELVLDNRGLGVPDWLALAALVATMVWWIS